MPKDLAGMAVEEQEPVNTFETLVAAKTKASAALNQETEAWRDCGDMSGGAFGIGRQH